MAKNTAIPPIPSIGNPYTYIDTIKQYHEDIWNDAVNLVDSYNNNISLSANERRNNAVDFLNSMASQWQSNELAFLNNELQKLEKASSELPDNPELKQAITEVTSILSNLNTNNFNYQKFTEAINIAIKGLNSYKARLSNIQANFKTPKRDRYLLEGIDTEFYNIVNILNGSANWIKEEDLNYEQEVASYVANYVNQHKEELKAAVLDDNQFTAWLLRLSLQFRQYLEITHKKERERLNNQYKQKRNSIERNFENFIQEYNEQLLNFTPEKRKLLSEIATSMNFTEYDSSIDKKFIQLPTLQDNPVSYNIGFKSNFSPSALDEQMQLLLTNSLESFLQMGGSNMGNDSLAATISITYDKPKYDQELQTISDTLHKIEKSMTAFSKVRGQRDRVYKNFLEMNNQLTNILKSLDNTIKQLDPKAQAFIIHESDKYYQSMEKGYKKNKMGESGFHGRTMAILSYIDIMSGLSYNFGLGNPQLLKFVAYNLGSHSPGHHMISQLEEIFTYAAGMIMFDDINLAVREAVGTLQFSNITTLHLYKLQELYVPGSYLLQETAKYLAGCPYDETNAITASIEVGDNIFIPNYTRTKNYSKLSDKNKSSVKGSIQSYNKKSTAEQWDQMRDHMASNTKVSIHFFLNFAQFIAGMR